MEEIDRKEIEQAKIFASLKEMYSLGGSSENFKRLLSLKYSLTIVPTWDDSVYNRFIDTTYFKLKSKRIKEKWVIIAIATLSSRQYRLVLNH